MIKAEAIRNKDGKIVSLTVKGHANSAPKGQDLVCAAVSTVLVGGCNALEQPELFTIKLNPGDAYIAIKGNPNKHDRDLLHIMWVQLKTIEFSNAEYLHVIEKGNSLCYLY